MKNAMIKNNITLRELWKLTGIEPSRLSDIKFGRAVPNALERLKINDYLGNEWEYEKDPNRADQKKFEEETHLKTILDVMGKIKKQHGKTNAKGTFKPCPACGEGVLSYVVHGYNGHVWMKCSTEKCISVME